MAFTIYNNLISNTAQKNLGFNVSTLSKSVERLSSGMRVNHASDDASGLAISEKLRGQIRGLAKASQNIQDGISYLQAAEGSMEAVGDMLQRMRELAVQAGNGVYSTTDRAILQKEVDSLKSSINRITAAAEYNTKKLLNGDAAAIWGTNAPKTVQAIVRGDAVDGDYQISATVTNAGKAYTYETNPYYDAKNSVAATTTSFLKDITKFTTDEGRYIFSSLQKLVIYNQGKQAEVYINGEMTMGDLVDAIEEAMKTFHSSAFTMVASTTNNIGGAYEISSSLEGESSSLAFLGDEALINALGLNIIQEGEEGTKTVSVFTVGSTVALKTVTVTGGLARNIIQGIDLKVGTVTAGVDVYLHVKNNRTVIQTGANEGQLTNVSVGQLNTTGLEIDNVYVTTLDLSQKAITSVNNALSLVADARAAVGAQMAGLEYTLRNVAIGRENMMAAESRIRDADIAEETSNFTRNLILVNSATAMLAQANAIPNIALSLIAG